MNKEKTSQHSELLYNRLIKRYRHLKKWAKRMEINSYRLYDRDIPEIPLVLDLYDDAISGAIFMRPGEIEEYTENWLQAIKAAIEKALGINGSFIFIKERREMKKRQYKGDQYEKLSGKNFYRDVKEGDLLFRVNLSDYLDTGLFLDSRKKRTLLRNEAAGKKVLNLFAYTSTLSVAAAKGGAASVDSVDLS
ncbi:MAG: class I SAM-dependent methyltransferase, partial [Treponema sp.]|nr:class I SAM-dependent methyltransferase [Treponema sp.]